MCAFNIFKELFAFVVFPLLNNPNSRLRYCGATKLQPFRQSAKKKLRLFSGLSVSLLLKILTRILPRKKSQSPSFKELLSLKSGCKNRQVDFNMQTKTEEKIKKI
jgi:hypothetical protein